MVFKKGIKRITIYRFLIAKLVHDPDGLSIEDSLALYELNLYLNRKTEKDQTFSNKYGLWLITTNSLIERISEIRVFPFKLRENDRTNLERALTPFLPSSRAFFGYMKQPRIRNSYEIHLRNPLFRPKKYEKPYIGVGYRDKGSRRDKARDGSPDWKEVASSSSYEVERGKQSPNQIKDKIIRALNFVSDTL